MAFPADKDVRAAIKTIIQGAAPNAIVFPRWILKGVERGQWPGLLKPTVGADAGKTHGYTITRARNRGRKLNAQRKKRFWTYSIVGLHWYDTGNDTTNTEDIFKAELDAICDALDAAAITGTQQVDDELIEFIEDIAPYGNEWCHAALGTLVLEPCG